MDLNARFTSASFPDSTAPADIGLVRDGFGIKQDDGITDLVRLLHRFGFRLRHLRDHRGNLGNNRATPWIRFRQDRAPRPSPHQSAPLALARPDLSRHPLRKELQRFVEGAEIVRVSPHLREYARRCVRIRERRNACGVEDFFAIANVLPAHPAHASTGLPSM